MAKGGVDARDVLDGAALIVMAAGQGARGAAGALEKIDRFTATL